MTIRDLLQGRRMVVFRGKCPLMGESWSIMRHIQLQPAAERSCPACLLTHLPCYLKIDVKSRAHKFKMWKTTSSHHLVNTMYLLSFAALPQCFCLYPPLKNVQYASWPSSELCFLNFIYHTSVINNEISALAAVASTIKPHHLHIGQFPGSPWNLLINDSQLVWSHQRWDLFMNHDQQNPAEDLCKTNIGFLWITTYF